MTQHSFVLDLDERIRSRKKMTHPLYQTILGGSAPQKLLQNFVLHRIPIKSLWTRNIMGIAARVEDYQLRAQLVSNIYEEETGGLSQTIRHLETFFQFGEGVGLSRSEMRNPIILPETQSVIDHNTRACNSDMHFTAGVASVLLLMEGQPPIVSDEGKSMEDVMLKLYGLPETHVVFFRLHASHCGNASGVSDLEDEHAEVARELLRKYCDTDELHQQATTFLERAIDLRHRHFDAIYNNFYDKSQKPFRWPGSASMIAASPLA